MLALESWDNAQNFWHFPILSSNKIIIVFNINSFFHFLISQILFLSRVCYITFLIYFWLNVTVILLLTVSGSSFFVLWSRKFIMLWKLDRETSMPALGAKIGFLYSMSWDKLSRWIQLYSKNTHILINIFLNLKFNSIVYTNLSLEILFFIMVLSSSSEPHCFIHCDKPYLRWHTYL